MTGYTILPEAIRKDKNLTFFEKVLYGEIAALTNKEGFCFATNKYLSEFFCKSTRYVSKGLSKLQNLGYLSLRIDKDGGNDRKIYLGEMDKKTLFVPIVPYPMEQTEQDPMEQMEPDPMEQMEQNPTPYGTTEPYPMEQTEQNPTPYGTIVPDLWNYSSRPMELLFHHNNINTILKNNLVIPNGITRCDSAREGHQKEQTDLVKLPSTGSIDPLAEIVKNYSSDEKLQETLFEYIKMRKLIKKPLTPHSLKLCLTEKNRGLNALCGDDTEKAIEILNQSIRNSWQGLFPLKEFNTGRASPVEKPKKKSFLEMLEEA